MLHTDMIDMIYTYDINIHIRFIYISYVSYIFIYISYTYHIHIIYPPVPSNMAGKSPNDGNLLCLPIERSNTYGYPL